jgi:hemerythrin
MQEVYFDKIEEHKAMHKTIETEMQSFIQKLPVIGVRKFEEELALFIEKWLVYHVINADRKIGEWIKAHEVRYKPDEN